jgi:hypothetical protein
MVEEEPGSHSRTAMARSGPRFLPRWLRLAWNRSLTAGSPASGGSGEHKIRRRDDIESGVFDSLIGEIQVLSTARGVQQAVTLASGVADRRKSRERVAATRHVRSKAGWRGSGVGTRRQAPDPARGSSSRRPRPGQGVRGRTTLSASTRLYEVGAKRRS